MKISMNEIRRLVVEAVNENIAGLDDLDAKNNDPLYGIDPATGEVLPASGRATPSRSVRGMAPSGAQKPSRSASPSTASRREPRSPAPTARHRRDAAALVRTARAQAASQPASRAQSYGIYENSLRKLIRKIVQEQMNVGNLPPRAPGSSRLPPAPTEPPRQRSPQQSRDDRNPPVPDTEQPASLEEKALTEMIRKIVRQTYLYR